MLYNKLTKAKELESTTTTQGNGDDTVGNIYGKQREEKELLHPLLSRLLRGDRKPKLKNW